MADLRKRFGQLVAAHRRRAGLSQEALAEAADLSIDMVSKIETGATGARFPIIERLAAALKVDPAELFTAEIPWGRFKRMSFSALSSRLATLSDMDLIWIARLVDAALKPRVGDGAPQRTKESTSGAQARSRK